MDIYTWLNDSEDNHWHKHVNDSLPLLEQLQVLIDKSIRLPNHGLQRFIFASICLINPVLFNAVPIVWITGPSETGKTTLMELANIVVGWETTDHFLTGSTRTSLRNDLRERFYVDCEQAEIEEREPNVMRHGARLTLDNAYNSSFKDEEYRTLVITGYRRGAKLKTASADEVGKNKSFPIYSLKIVSSIDDCSESPALVELATRTIFLRTDSIHSLSKEDLGQFDLNEQLQLDSVNWRGFSDQFNNAWDTQGGPTEQLKRVKHALSVLKKVKFKLSPRQQTLTCTAIASAYAFSGDMTIEEMLNLWGEYWTWVAKRKQSLLASLIKRNFLVDELFSLVSKDEVGMPTDLSCVLLQDYFLRLKKEGQIKKDDDLDLAMSELGYYRKEIGKEARWILRNSVSC